MAFLNGVFFRTVGSGRKPSPLQSPVTPSALPVVSLTLLILSFHDDDTHVPKGLSNSLRNARGSGDRSGQLDKAQVRPFR